MLHPVGIQSLALSNTPHNSYLAVFLVLAQTPLTQYFLQQGVRMYAFAYNYSTREVRR